MISRVAECEDLDFAEYEESGEDPRTRRMRDLGSSSARIVDSPCAKADRAEIGRERKVDEFERESIEGFGARRTR